MTTKHLIQVVDEELMKINVETNPVRRSLSQISTNSLKRIRTQLQLNTDTRSIVDQLENELVKYAFCVKECELEHISDSNPAAVLVHKWGESLRVIFNRLREDRRFASEIERMVKKIA